MKPSRAPLQDLEDLVERGETGELVCAISAAEIHVYLQRGRIAWATASSRPFEFARHLKQHAGIDDDTLRKVVDECRLENLPFGETLIAWGLASAEAVKAALEHQTRTAVEALAKIQSASTLFLERRRFTEYSSELTFELRQLLPESLEEGAPASAAGTRGLAQQLLEAIEGASWIEILDEESAVDAAPEASTSPRVPSALLANTLLDDADFVAVRGALGTVIGVRLPAPRRTLWCMLSADSTFGTAISTLGSLNFMRAQSEAETEASRQRGDDCWELGDRACPEAREIRAVLGRAPEVLAAVILCKDEPLFGLGGAPLDRERCLALFSRRSRTFDAPLLLPESAPTRAELNPLGFRFRTMATGERGLWCFGAELAAEGDRTLWLLTDRSVSQGLGWACVAALRRGLGNGCSPSLRHVG